MNTKEGIVLALILAVALTVRLYKIDRPLADWHSWRQADTAAVARNFIKDGFNPFVPRYDDMSSQANGLDNPNRYRFVEFPLYNLLIAAVWKLTGIQTVSARLTTVFITLVSTVFLYLVVRHFSSTKTAALASFFFATLPYNVFYSSTILPAPLMVTSLLALYFFFTKWLDDSKKWFYLFLSIFFANIAILTWPIAIFFLLPLLYLSFTKYKWSIFKKVSLWLFALFSFAPFMVWRIWMLNFPEGIPNWQFLINSGNIRFKGAFFRWLVAERLGKLILTVGGFSLFILGFLSKFKEKEAIFYFSWLLSVIIYFTTFASGNVRHDYYQVPAVPILAIFMAHGTKLLFEFKSPNINRHIMLPVALFLIFFMYAFGIYEIRGYYWINRPQIIEAGQAVDKLIPKDATVIAPYNGDAAFLYQTNRRGYPVVDRSLEDLVSLGTKYLVSVDISDQGIQKLTQNCNLLEKTNSFIILELSKDCLTK